jgi:hypothetical protein
MGSKLVMMKDGQNLFEWGTTAAGSTMIGR